MKILDTPRSGACGEVVAFQSRYGLCLRQRIRPRNTVTPAREFMRAAFGHHSQVFSHRLSDEQLDRWSLAAAQVMSDPRLGQHGLLTAQQLYAGINSVRSRVNLPETREVPPCPAWSVNPVGALVALNTEDGVRLLLRVSGELKEDVMVFGQEPCSSGRRKRRNVCYLGLLPPPVGGLSDITHLYNARFGEPRPGTRVFIVTCQEKDGWKAVDHETNAIVPERPKGEQAAAAPSNSQNPYMHKGSPRDAQGIEAPVASQFQDGNQAETRDGEGRIRNAEDRKEAGEAGSG